MTKLENQTILIISNEPWGKIWFSKHNWAYELSQNNQVFFVNSPQKWVFKHLFENKIRIQDYSDSLHIFDYNNRLPFTRFKFIYQLNEYFVSKTIKNWFKKKQISDYIYWTFDPYRFSNPQLLSPIKSLYFRVDKYIVNQEKTLIENVDATIVTSEVLLEDINVGKHLVLSHGISQEEFNCTDNIEYEQGYFLYVGNIDFRLDVKLIKMMLLEFPTKKFLFIGKKTDTKNELFLDIFVRRKYENMILHGIEHFKNLKNYIYNSKACLAPMDTENSWNTVHHHKTLQYLAMGKPLISPIFNDVINNDKFILGYKNSDEAIELIKGFELLETEDKIQGRITFARQFLYSNLITKVENFLSQI